MSMSTKPSVMSAERPPFWFKLVSAALLQTEVIAGGLLVVAACLMLLLPLLALPVLLLLLPLRPLWLVTFETEDDSVRI